MLGTSYKLALAAVNTCANNGDIIGKYERGENTPSIEVASKLEDAFSVTLDYLVKDAEYEQINRVTLNRLHEVEKLPQDLKEKNILLY